MCRAIASAATFSGSWTFNDARYRSLAAESEDGGAPVILNGLRVYNTSKYVGDAAIDLSRARRAVACSGERQLGRQLLARFDEPGVVLRRVRPERTSARRRRISARLEATSACEMSSTARIPSCRRQRSCPPGRPQVRSLRIAEHASMR